MRLLQTLPGFNSVGHGQKAESNLAVGPTYDNIHLELFASHPTIGGGAPVLVTLANLGTHVSFINLIADGTKIVRRVTPALLSAYLQRKNLLSRLADSAGTAIKSAVLPFADPTRPEVVGQDSTALGTLGIKQLILQVELLNPQIGGVSYTYSLRATGDLQTQAAAGKLFASLLEVWNVDSFDVIAGLKPFNTISTTDDLLGIILDNSAAGITKVEVFADGNKTFSATNADVFASIRYHQDAQGAVANSYFPLEFDRTRQVTDVMPLANRDASGKPIVIDGKPQRVGDFSIEITATNAGNVKALRRNLWRGN